MNTFRPVSISHLVFGLIFLGITALWVIGETTDAEAPAFAVWGPVVLIGAGAVGLLAALVNTRRRDAIAASTTDQVGSDSSHHEEQS
jgi:hypothetical protein